MTPPVVPTPHALPQLTDEQLEARLENDVFLREILKSQNSQVLKQNQLTREILEVLRDLRDELRSTGEVLRELRVELTAQRLAR